MTAAPRRDWRHRGAHGLAAGSLLVAGAAACSSDDTRTSADATTTGATAAAGGGEATSSSTVAPEEDTVTDPTRRDQQRNAIAQTYRHWQRAMVDGDTDALRRLSLPTSSARHISGYEQPREEWFSQIDSGYFHYHAIDNASLDVAVHSATSATLVSRSTIDVTIDGSRGTWQLQSTAEYVRVDGRWLSGDSSSRLQ